jgi:hypothetical protein
MREGFATFIILVSLVACTIYKAAKIQSSSEASVMGLLRNDELNTLFAFDITGGKPIASIDLTALLNLKTTDEIDIEAAMVYGQHIWWLGSHSLDKKGVIAPNRQKLFATNIPSTNLSDLKLVTQPVDLSAVLMKSEKLTNVLTEATRKRLPKEGGINIEGLASTADGGFLLGFRSPLNGSDGITGDALVARIVPYEENFAVQQVYFLDLADRGIRDIINYGNQYLIIAGPVASGGDFSLYAWDGYSQPERLIKLNEMNAEGIVDLGSHWLLLSDDGKVVREDNEASDGYRKCDRIRSKNSSGGAHPGVFFHAEKVQKRRVLLGPDLSSTLSIDKIN